MGTDRKLQDLTISTISGNRRRDRRYAAGLPMEYAVINAGGLIAAGRGTTIDLSSGGVSFAPGRIIPQGATVQISIEWPGGARLEVSGTVVRSGEQGTAMRSAQRAFVPQPQRLAVAEAFCA